MNERSDQSSPATTTLEGPLLLRGPAGTGKTQFLAERAAWLARERFTGPDDRILVTAFSPEGLKALKERTEALAGNAAARLVFANLQPWAKDLLAPRLRSQRIAGAKQTASAWGATFAEIGDLQFPDHFYRDEWDRVVQADGLVSRTAFVKSLRKGRHQRLDRAQRLQVWDVLSRYRSRLDTEGLFEWADLMREARLLFDEGHEQRIFKAAVCDEVQEFRPAELALLRAIVCPGADDLSLAGDPRQRLWGFAFDLRDVGIQFDDRVLEAMSSKRCPPHLLDRAEALVADRGYDDLLGGSLPLRKETASQGKTELPIRVTSDESELRFWETAFRSEGDILHFDAVLAQSTEGGPMPLAQARRHEGPRILVTNAGRLGDDLKPDDFADSASLAEAQRRLITRLYVAVTRATEDFLILATKQPPLWS
ncbi:MAG: AAA family ATPase [Planctomycetes bacterium]|nr:AAA family ATPase [Planctomycetota bacterium]